MAVTAIGGYLLLGTTSIVQAGWRYTANSGGAHGLEMFLAAHNLRDGYGEYWNTNNAELLNIKADDGIDIRALWTSVEGVKTGYLWPRVAASSILWDHESPSFHPTFVIFSQTHQGYKHAAIKTFGFPQKVVKYKNCYIYIYDRSLTPGFVSALNENLTMINNRRTIEIHKICSAIDVRDSAFQRAYIWLVSHGVTKIIN